MKHRAYLCLGTNLGDRLANLKNACSRLPPGVSLVEGSPVYETPPWGYKNQPAFLNQVVKVETELEPHELMATLKRIEVAMGRQESIRYGPRLIDMDILFYDDLVLDIPDLTIPHPRMAGRAFVLVPLADLAPDLMHPVELKTVRQMLEGLDRSGIEVFLGE